MNNFINPETLIVRISEYDHELLPIIVDSEDSSKAIKVIQSLTYEEIVKRSNPDNIPHHLMYALQEILNDFGVRCDFNYTWGTIPIKKVELK